MQFAAIEGDMSSDDDNQFYGLNFKSCWKKEASFSRLTSPGSTAPGSHGSSDDETMSTRSPNVYMSEEPERHEEHNDASAVGNDASAVGSTIEASTEARPAAIAKWQVVTPYLPVWTAKDLSAVVVSKLEEGTFVYGRQKGDWLTLHDKPWCCKISDGERAFLNKVHDVTSTDEIARGKSVGHARSLGCTDGLTKLTRQVVSTLFV